MGCRSAPGGSNMFVLKIGRKNIDFFGFKLRQNGPRSPPNDARGPLINTRVAPASLDPKIFFEKPILGPIALGPSGRQLGLFAALPRAHSWR